MNKKLFPSLTLIVMGCNNDICDTGISNDVIYSVNQTTEINYNVTVTVPDSVYGMYLITKNKDCERDQIECGYHPEGYTCEWNLENNPPLGIRLYDSYCSQFEIKF